VSRRDTADAQLERILSILPAAARPDGATFDELARALDVPVTTVLADIERVTSRAYYHPAGSADTCSVAVLGDRVHVHAPQEFNRPTRLTVREALALSLGLRALAAEADAGRGAAIVAFAERLESELASPAAAPAATAAPTQAATERSPEPDAGASPRQHAAAAGDAAGVEYDREAEVELLLDLGADDARGDLARAIELRHRCTLLYVKPGEPAPSRRRVEPHLLVFHQGAWYIIAHDIDRAAQRVFRLDRIIEVRLDDDTFDPPGAVDAGAFFRDGVGPLASDVEDEVVVRYSPRIARWIAERTRSAIEDDGSVRVRHRVADARWIVRHVLQYGGDAVLEGSAAYRALVAATARRIAS
jgi:predicted DNA-binding transcriptional regulator YafY